MAAALSEGDAVGGARLHAVAAWLAFATVFKEPLGLWSQAPRPKFAAGEPMLDALGVLGQAIGVRGNIKFVTLELDSGDWYRVRRFDAGGVVFTTTVTSGTTPFQGIQPHRIELAAGGL